MGDSHDLLADLEATEGLSPRGSQHGVAANNANRAIKGRFHQNKHESVLIYKPVAVLLFYKILSLPVIYYNEL